MTTVQTMLKNRFAGVARVCALVGLIGSVFVLTTSCQSERGKLEVPEVLVSPYDSTRGNTLLAVVPLNNESGVSFVDAMSVSDAIVAKLQETRGLSCVPLNRSIAGLRAMNSSPVGTPQQAKALANALGVDGLIVGTITAYDPYNPPKLGLNLALFMRDVEVPVDDSIDPFSIQTQSTDFTKKLRTQYLEKPASVVSVHLDASNHEVLMDLKRYSIGRHDDASAMGWRGALASMDLYTQFAAYQAVSRLIEQERLRLVPPPPPPPSTKGAKQAGR